MFADYVVHRFVVRHAARKQDGIHLTFENRSHRADLLGDAVTHRVEHGFGFLVALFDVDADLLHGVLVQVSHQTAFAGEHLQHVALAVLARKAEVHERSGRHRACTFGCDRAVGIGVIRSLQRLKINKKPLFFVKSSFSSPTLEHELMSNGVSYFTVEPFHAQDLADRMLQLTGYQNKIEDKLEENNVNHLPSLEIQVTEILHQIGVPAHIKGYHYLRDSIIMAIETPEIINAVTKQLYPSVAKRYETTSSRVERAIRHAIEVAWDRGDVDVLNSYFGYTIHNTRGKPTNSEFIAMISDKLRLQMKTAS